MRYTSIVGLSAERRIPRVGKIRLGEKVATANGGDRPAATDHFVVPPEVAAVLGERPIQLDVMFPSDDLGVVFPVAYKYYRRALLWCTGNGQTGTRIDEESKGFKEVECPCEFLEQKNACRHAGSLMMMIPRVSIGGVYQMDTPSRNNIIAIQSGIEHARGLLGRISWVPFVLTLTPRQMTVQGQLKTVHLVNLLLASFEQIQQSRLQLQGLRALVAPSSSEPVLLVAAPEDEPEEHETEEPAGAAPARPAGTAPAPDPEPEPPPQMTGGELVALEGRIRRIATQLKKGTKATDLAIATATRRGTLPQLAAELERQLAGGKGDPIVWNEDARPPSAGTTGDEQRLVDELYDLGEVLGFAPNEVAERVKSVRVGGMETVKKLHAAWTSQVAKKGKGSA